MLKEFSTHRFLLKEQLKVSFQQEEKAGNSEKKAHRE